jgi:uncharacterized protein YecT (DUF1311 family)
MGDRRIQAPAGKGEQKLVVALLLSASIASSQVRADPCDGADTISMAKCMDGKIARATQRLNEYTGRAKARFESEDRSTMKAISDAAVAFEAYRKTYCGAVFEEWREGTIRYAMHQNCELRLIDQQTHHVWQDFLTYVDSTPPLLPEPKPTD